MSGGPRRARWHKSSFRVPGGQYEFRVGAFGLHGMSSLLMHYMRAILERPNLDFEAESCLVLAGHLGATPAPQVQVRAPLRAVLGPRPLRRRRPAGSA
mmetsp:Transcript_17245/g.47394  ORF Transcript_17245/g.47394 Transcript_17245/m.47394 type:complete len:98 (-) Transcript_17245:304-597(-)